MEGRKFWFSVSKDKAPRKFGADEHRRLLHDNLLAIRRSHRDIIQHIMCNKSLLSFRIPFNRSGFAEFMYLQARKYLVSPREPRQHMPKVLRGILASADSCNRYRVFIYRLVANWKGYRRQAGNGGAALVILSRDALQNLFIPKVFIIFEDKKSATNEADSRDVSGLDYGGFHGYVKGLRGGVDGRLRPELKIYFSLNFLVKDTWRALHSI